MADLLEDLEAYFAAQEVLGESVVHLDTSLDTPDDEVSLFEYPGVSSIPQIDTTLRSIQIVARNTTAEAARLRANELYRSLKTEDGILSLTETRWGLIHLRQPPFQMKVDNKGRTYYVFNVGITTYFY